MAYLGGPFCLHIVCEFFHATASRVVETELESIYCLSLYMCWPLALALLAHDLVMLTSVR